jgi:hypothetical protein
MRAKNMSAPSQLHRDAEELSYSFLAARASDVLQHALENQPLNQDDSEVLSDAALFLKAISDGARFTGSGTFRQGAIPSHSIAALDVAFGPIEALRQVASERDLVSAFDDLSVAVNIVRETGSAIQHEVEVQKARLFFEELSNWLESEFSTRRSTLGTRHDRFL